VFLSFFYALKTKLQVLKFEVFHMKLG